MPRDSPRVLEDTLSDLDGRKHLVRDSITLTHFESPLDLEGNTKPVEDTPMSIPPPKGNYNAVEIGMKSTLLNFFIF